MAPSLLKVLGGPLAGKELIFENTVAEVVIGADQSCNFRLELPAVSAVHARLRREPGGIMLHDGGSPRGVFVNDDRVQGAVPLRSGDILWLGPPGDGESVMIRCRLPPEPSAPAGPAQAEPPRAAAPPPARGEAEVEPFFIADTVASGDAASASASDEFVIESAADAPPVVVADSFLVEEAPSPPPAPEEDAFFIAEPEAAPPTAPRTPEPPAPRPAPPAAPAAPVAAPAPQATPPASAVPRPAVQQKPAAPASAPGKPPPGPASAPRAPAAAAQPQSPSRAPARKPEAAPIRAQTAKAGPRPGKAPVPTPARRPAPARSSGAPMLRVAIAVGAVALVGAGYLALRRLGAPRLAAVSPARAKVGQQVTLAGSHFASDASGNRVLFGDVQAKVTKASADKLEVEVPELPTTGGRDVAFPVIVEVGSRRTSGVEIQVFQTPRIHGLSPDVAMPGDELTLAGGGWGPGATVRFGSLAADVTQATPTSLRVRVPAVEGPAGTSVPVQVTMGDERSNEAPFLVGRLPLIQHMEPATAAPGDVVTLSGRGFHAEARQNGVQIGGVHALVLGSDPGGLQVVVPWTAAGETTVEIRVPGSGEPGRASLHVTPAADPVEWRFVAEPFDAAAGHARAFVGTALGPAFAFSASGGKSAAERALEAAHRLNEAAGPLRASLDADLEAHGASVRLKPKGTSVLEVTTEDAAAYEEDRTRQGSRAAVTPERLALWWTALARDLVLVLLRSQKPSYTSVASEGRVLTEVYQAARRSGGFGLPRQVVADLKPAQRQALRLLAERVPASLAGPPPAGGGPVAASLRLQGNWTGFEVQGGERKNISVAFGRNGGTLTFTDGVGLGVPLLAADIPQRNTMRFSAQVRGGVRYYVGGWDGERVKGGISADASGRSVVGNFELTPGP